MSWRRRALITAATVVATPTANLAAVSAPVHAAPPDGLQIVAVSSASGGSFGDVHWREGRVYAVRSGATSTEIREYPLTGATEDSPTRTTAIPAQWSSDRQTFNGPDAFEVAPDGSFYVRAPRNLGRYPDSSASGWGVGLLSPDETITPAAPRWYPAAYADEFGGSSRSLVMDPDGSGLLLGGIRQVSYGAGGNSYGIVAKLPIPLPADPQAGAEVLVSGDGYDPNDSSTRFDPPFAAENHVRASVDPFMGSIMEVDAKGPFLYVNEGGWNIHRVDRRTDQIVSVCCRYWSGWDPPAPIEGGLATETHFEISAGPVADRAGNLFFAHRRSGVDQIWQIRGTDGTLHRVAGGGAGPVENDADPLAVELRDVADLDMDPDGNLYLAADDQILRLPEVGVADTAPSAPRQLEVEPGSASLDVSWAEPADDGGQPIESYTVRVHPTGVTGTAQDVVITMPGRTLTVPGLTDETSYDVSVVATNSRGSGPAASTSASPGTRASLTATPSTVDANGLVQLDASASRVPAGSTFEFFCDGRFRVPAPSSGRTAECRYPRGSNDQGYPATVVVTGPDGEQTWSDSVPVHVSDPTGTVEGSSAFDGSDPADVEVQVASDGSLSSDRILLGARVVLTAAEGTFRPGSTVRIHRGEVSSLQDELGSGVSAHGGFAITWVDASGKKYDLAKPLIVTITPEAGVERRAVRRAGWDIGAAFQQWGESFVSGVTSVVGTIGSAFQFLGSAISNLWASAAQALDRPNGSRTNDLATCSSFLIVTGASSYRCEGTLTVLRDVPTDRIAAIDAGARVVSAGGANVVSAGGANVVSAGGANVVSAGGANLTLAANSVISAGGGNVVSAGGANVVSAGGANVVSAGGANVVSAGGANVVSAGGANLTGGRLAMTMMLVRDPGFAFAQPDDPTPPTAGVVLDPAVPSGGVYPYGTTVTAHITGTPAGAKSVQRVHYEVTGSQPTPYTIVDAATTDLTITGSGTATLTYGVVDDQLVGSDPAAISVRIAAPAVPSAPAAPTGEAGPLHDSIQFTWAAPAETGDLALTGYTLRVTDHGLVTDGSAAEPALTRSVTGTLANITGLHPGHRYTATVSAVSGAGASEPSAASAAVVTADPPEAPSALTATAGDGQVSLSWAAPLDDGGLPVIEYVVSRGTSADGPFTPVGTTATRAFTDSGVTNGSTFYYVAQAVNHLGVSGRSSVVSARPAAPVTPPGPPGPVDPPAPPDPTDPPGPTDPPEPKEQTLVLTMPSDLRYGDPDHALVAEAGSGLPVRFTSLTTGVCTVAGSTLHVVAAGRCAIEAAQAGSEDWSPVSVVRTVDVARAPLSVRATDARMVRRGAAPAVSATYTGLVAGDTPYDLVTPATCQARPGSGRTTCTAAASPNYEMSFVDGRLKVLRRGPAFVSAAAVHARAGELVRHRLLVDGAGRRPRLRWEGELPDGVTAHHDRNRTQLWFAGTPTTAGTYQVKVRAMRDGRRVTGQVVTVHVW